VLTDNEKTVTTGHVAGIAVRDPAMVDFARFYGVTVHTCQPCDPASKGGSESSVKIAKADLVPKDTNLLERYESFGRLCCVVRSQAMLRRDLASCTGQMAGLSSSNAVVNPEQRVRVDGELVLATAQVLDEGVLLDHRTRPGRWVFNPRIGRSRALSRPWSHSTWLFSYWPV